jgi:hypothetical protein
MIEVLYCYRCGKHVKRDGGKCWYCSAPTRRVIRPPRKCPFCDEEIGAKAIKCPHCGEFLDGRERTGAQTERTGPAQVVYVIDKAIIQGEKPLLLQGGGQVPPQVARMLSDQTVEAIRSNNPALIDQPGVKALPAPANSPIDIDAEEVSALPGARRAESMGEPGTASHAPPSEASHRKEPDSGRQADRDLPVRRQETLAPAPLPEAASATQQITRALVRGAGYALAKAGHWAYEALQSRAGEAEVISDAEESDPYLICTFCHTEVLKADNYCFHCGVLLRGGAARPDIKIEEPRKPTGAILIIAAFLTGAFVYLRKFAGPLPGFEFGAPLTAGLALLLLVAAFFRRRTSANQISVIVLVALWLIAAIFAFFPVHP